MEMKKILFATDYSEASRHAFEFATSLACDTGAALLIAHVTDLEQYPVGEHFNEEPQPDPTEMRDRDGTESLRGGSTTMVWHRICCTFC